MLRTLAVALAAALLLAAGALLLGGRRWRADTEDALARLDAEPGRAVVDRYTAAELDGLPAPVQRYFRAVLRDGQQVHTRARIVHAGTFLMRAPDGWRPFRSVEHLASHPAGFVWDAQVRAAPGFTVRVRDSFLGGTGSMRASLLGLIPLVAVDGTPDLARGALHRWLAEAPWLPTALLPSAGVIWAPVDDSTARATLAVDGVTVWLDFHFGADSLITRTWTPARGREVNGSAVPTPWQGRCTDWAERGGMRIPLVCEVEWLLPEGTQTYWRGRITDVEFAGARGGSGRRRGA
jgi:hypothetical protein